MLRTLSPLRPLLLCVLMPIVLLGCEPDAALAVRVGMIDWPGYGALQLALDDDLAGEPFERVRLRSATQVINALEAGMINAAALTLDETLVAIDQGVDLHIIAITDISSGADQLLVKPHIHALADLKGRRLALEQTALGAYIYQRLLDLSGLKDGDIELLPATVDSHVSVFQRADVDAVISFEPAAARLRELGAQVLLDSRTELADEIFDVIAVRANAGVGEAQQRQLLRAYFAARERLQRREPQAMAAVAAQLRVEVPALAAMLRQIKLPDAAANQRLLRHGGELMQAAERIGAQLYRSGVLHLPCHCTELIYRPPNPSLTEAR